MGLKIWGSRAKYNLIEDNGGYYNGRTVEDALQENGYLHSVNGSNGFPTRTTSTIGFVEGTRTFTITGTDFAVVHSNVIYTKNTESIVISDITGLHGLVYDNGVLTDLMGVSAAHMIIGYDLVAFVYWDAVNDKAVYYADERHGTNMSSSTHALLHVTDGARYGGGMALANMSVDQTGAVDADAQCSINSGDLYDEDLHHSLATQIFPATIPVIYVNGATWEITSPIAFPVKPYSGGSGRLAWNEDTGGGTHVQTEVTNGNFMLMHIFATNDARYPYFAIQGQAEYSNKNDAEDGAETEILHLFTTGLPMEEGLPIATLIYQTKNTYANTVKAKVVSTITGADYVDWREQTVKGGGVITASSDLILDTSPQLGGDLDVNDYKINALTSHVIVFANNLTEVARIDPTGLTMSANTGIVLSGLGIISLANLQVGIGGLGDAAFGYTGITANNYAIAQDTAFKTTVKSGAGQIIAIYPENTDVASWSASGLTMATNKVLTLVGSSSTAMQILKSTKDGILMQSRIVWHDSTGTEKASVGYYSQANDTFEIMNILGHTAIWGDGASIADFSSAGMTMKTGKNIYIPDNAKLFLSGSDGSLYHDNSNLYLTNAVGHLTIANTGTDILLTQGGSTIVTVDATGLTMTPAKHIYLKGDNTYLNVGLANDLQIYHNGTHSFITNATGGLYLDCVASSVNSNCQSFILDLNSQFIIRDRDDADAIVFVLDTTVRTFAIGTASDVIATTFNGSVDIIGAVDITGTLTATSFGGIISANLLDKTATEIISGYYRFDGAVIIDSDNTLAPLYISRNGGQSEALIIATDDNRSYIWAVQDENLPNFTNLVLISGNQGSQTPIIIFATSSNSTLTSYNEEARIDTSGLVMASGNKITINGTNNIGITFVNASGFDPLLWSNSSAQTLDLTGIFRPSGGIILGTSGIGNNAAVLTFATGGTGIASFAGGIIVSSGNLDLTLGYIITADDTLAFTFGKSQVGIAGSSNAFFGLRGMSTSTYALIQTATDTAINAITGNSVLTTINGVAIVDVDVNGLSMISGKDIFFGAVTDEIAGIENQNLVDKSAGETISGLWLYSTFPVSPSAAPTNLFQFANKKYVDDSVSGLGTVTSVSGTAPISVATGTTTPVISMLVASAVNDGYMALAKFNEVVVNNAKVGYTAALARGDVIASSIVNADFIHAPDGNSVFDALALKVPTSRTVNGHALSSNVTVTASDVGLGNVTNLADGSQTALGVVVSGNIDAIVGSATLVGMGVNATAAEINAVADGSTAKNSHTHTYLPLAGGTITGDVLISDNIYLRFGVGNDGYLRHATTVAGNMILQGTSRISFMIGSATEVYIESTGLILPSGSKLNLGGIAVDDIFISSDGASVADDTLVTAGWVSAHGGTGDFKADGTVAMTGVLQASEGITMAANKVLTFATGESIQSNGTDLIIKSGADIHLQPTGGGNIFNIQTTGSYCYKPIWMSNGQYYAARLAAGTNTNIMGIDASNDLIIGATSGIDDVIIQSNDDMFLKVNTGGKIYFQVAGVSAGYFSSTTLYVGSCYTTNTGVQYLYGTSPNIILKTSNTTVGNGAIYFRGSDNIQEGRISVSSYRMNFYGGSVLNTYMNTTTNYISNGIAFYPREVYDDTQTTTANTYISSTGQLKRAISSIAVKKNIRSITNVDLIIDGLNPVIFKEDAAITKNDEDFGQDHYGFIAEEVAAICPDAAMYGRTMAAERNANGIEVPIAIDKDDVQHYDSQALLSIAVKAIQQLRTRVLTLETEIEALK